MLATGIIQKKGEQTTICLRHLEFLKAALQENLTIHITRAALHNKNHYFISVDYPDHSTPSKQLKANPHIIIRRGGNQLDEGSLLLFNRLQTEGDGEEVDLQDEVPQVDCQVIPVDEDNDNEPMLVEEEMEEQHLFSLRHGTLLTVALCILLLPLVFHAPRHYPSPNILILREVSSGVFGASWQQSVGGVQA